MFDPKDIMMRFRSASGASLAVLTYIDDRPWSAPSTGCKAVALTIRGRPQPPLIGGHFLRALGRLLGRLL
jgi:hypothetical protein